MDLPDILEAAAKRVSKPLPKRGGWIVMERDARDRWTHHTCATIDEAQNLARGLRSAQAIRLANEARSTPWRVSLEREAFHRGSRPHIDWRMLAEELIQRP